MGADPGPNVNKNELDLVYQQDFDDRITLDDFNFTKPGQWQWNQEDGGNGYLEIAEPNDYKPPVRSPRSIAVLNKYLVGDFVLEVDMLQKPVPHDCKGEDCVICQHRDMCVFWCMQDPSHFYYSHIAKHTDEVSHQIHIVNDAPRTAITKRRSEGVEWGRDKWNHIKVVHSAKKGTMKVYFNNMKKPVLVAEDTNFQKGYIGFGSFDELGKIDNIRLYSDDAEKKKTKLFDSKSLSN
jgi:hypothetical protein